MWIVAPVEAASRPWPGDVVGVVVGLEDVLDPHAQIAGQREVLLDVELGIDDRGHAGGSTRRDPRKRMSDLQIALIMVAAAIVFAGYLLLCERVRE